MHNSFALFNLPSWCNLLWLCLSTTKALVLRWLALPLFHSYCYWQVWFFSCLLTRHFTVARCICFFQSSQVCFEIVHEKFSVNINIVIVWETRPGRLQGKYGKSWMNEIRLEFWCRDGPQLYKLSLSLVRKWRPVQLVCSLFIWGFFNLPYFFFSKMLCHCCQKGVFEGADVLKG